MASGDFFWEEQYEPRPGAASMTAGRRLVRTFEVVWDEATVPPPSAAVTAGAIALPVPNGAAVYFGAEHPDFASCVCSEIEYTPHPDHPWLWTVTATYTEPRPVPGAAVSPPPPPPPGLPAPPPANPKPWERPPQIRMDFRHKDEVRTADLDGLPVVNSAGGPLANAPPVHTPSATIVVTTWHQTWTTAVGVAYVGKTNLAEWEGHPADSLLIDGIDVDPKTQDGFTFIQAVWTLVFKPLPEYPDDGQTGGWVPTSILDQGSEYIDAAGNLQAVKEDYGQGRGGVALLDGDGGLLNGTGRWDPLGDDPAYVYRRFADRISFAILSPPP